MEGFKLAKGCLYTVTMLAYLLGQQKQGCDYENSHLYRDDDLYSLCHE